MRPEADQTESSTVIHLSTREGYDRWSSIYDTDGNPLIALEEPLVDQLLGDLVGLKVIDLGCGTGRHAIRLAQAGASVQAVDFSEAMLARARDKAAGLNISFHQLDLTRQLPFADAAFDRVVCGLVLEHIKALDPFFAELRRLCRPGGCAVVSAMHPAMMLRGVQARFWDPESGQEVRPESHPNQLCDYIMAAARAGFCFEHVSEHAIDAALAERFPRGQRYVGWPVLLLMRLTPN
jgi:malonyl-CoA O-methyltransferase